MSDENKSGYSLDDKIDEYINPHVINKTDRKKLPKKPIEVAECDRFKPDIDKGLTAEQVGIRTAQLQTNVKGKVYSKSTGKIICSNVF